MRTGCRGLTSSVYPDGRVVLGSSRGRVTSTVVPALGGHPNQLSWTESYATGDMLVSKSAVSEITDRLWEDYQAFIARDLPEISSCSDSPPSRLVEKMHAWVRRVH